MAAQVPDDGPAVPEPTRPPDPRHGAAGAAARFAPEILALLSNLRMATSVIIQGPGKYRDIHITVCKVAQHQDGRTQYCYTWEAQGGTDGQAWEHTGGLTYESVAAAYQAAVEAVQAALPDQRPEDAQTGDNVAQSRARTRRRGTRGQAATR